jgi:hypothetical protein
MDSLAPSGPTAVLDVQTTGVAWPAIAAGAITAAALSLIPLAFGAGLGLSAVSPWSGSGVSATTFKVGSGIYLLIVAVMSSSIGGYLAARLRTRWTGLHTNEVFFRDTAHGLITWAFATVISAAVLGSAMTTIAGGAAAGLGAGATQAAAQASPTDIAVDTLFRPDPATTAAAPAAAAGNADTSRAEISRLWASSFRNGGGDLSTADRSYVARVVAARTGLNQAAAEQRVNEVITQTKQAADQARKAAAQFSLWLAASLLLGALGAGLAAVEGGQLRDGTWNERKLTPRTI